METSQHCVGCFFRQIEKTSQRVNLNRSQKIKALKYFTHKITQHDFSLPPVIFGREIYKAIARISGIGDIFAWEKIQVERYLGKNNRYIENIIHNSSSPLYLSAKMSAAANSIDFGAGHYRPDLPGLIKKLKQIKLKVDDYSLFFRQLATAKTILFVADNCGEAFFDKLFIEQIKGLYPQVKIYYAVRSKPIINDVTLKDARRLGIDKVADTFSSGCDYPGLILEKTSKHFRKIYDRADIVVSKGQGNFESFNPDKNIFYLFQVKCPAVRDFLKFPLNSVLFLHRKRIS